MDARDTEIDEFITAILDYIVTAAVIAIFIVFAVIAAQQVWGVWVS